MAKAEVKKEWRTHFEPKARLVDYKSVFKFVDVRTLDELKALFVGQKEFAFDTETTGLDYNVAKIAGFSFSFDGVTGYYVPIAHKKDKNAGRECLDFIVEKICDDNMTVLMFNKKFDLNMLELCEGYNIGIRFNVKCVQALVWLRDTDYSMPSLKWASEHFMGIVQPRYDSVAGETTFDYAMVSDVLEYACLDAICTKRLAVQTIQKYPNIQAIYDIDDKSIEAVRKMEHGRIRLDMDWLHKEETRIHFEIKEIEKKIFDMTGYEFNINSTMQTADALIRCGVVLTAKTPGGKWAVNMDVLGKVEHPLAKMLIAHSSKSTYLSTFIKNLIGESHDGWIRFNYKTCSVVTGRFSSGGDAKNPYYAALNAQNIPKPVQIEMAMVPDESEVTGWRLESLDTVAVMDGHQVLGAKEGFSEFYVVETGRNDGGVRCAFLPDDDESVWVSIDYAGQELRIAANFSGEPTFVDAFLHGRDPHMETAKKIWGESADKNARRDAKGANFALQYGGTGYTLATNLGITEQAGNAFYNTYCKAMAVLVQWQTYMKRVAKRDGVVYSAFGRPFRLRRFFADGAPWKMKSYGERCALNYPIQGSGGDVIRLALVRVLTYWGAMLKAGIQGFNSKSTIHDEINFSVRKDFLRVFMRSVPKMMYMHFPEWKVPLEVDCSIGHTWGEAVSYKYDDATKKFTPKGDYYKF